MTISGEVTTENPNPPESAKAEEGEKKTVAWEDFEKVNRANNWSQARTRQLETELEELKSQLNSKPSNSKKDESEAVKNAQAEIEKLRANIQSLETENKRTKIQGTVISEAAKHLASTALEDFWKLESDTFDVVPDENGQEKVIIKAAPWQSVSEFFSDYSKKKPHLAKNPLQQRGNGAPNPADGSNVGPQLPGNWSSLSQNERTEYFLKLSPEDRAVFKKQILGS